MIAEEHMARAPRCLLRVRDTRASGMRQDALHMITTGKVLITCPGAKKRKKDGQQEEERKEELRLGGEREQESSDLLSREMKESSLGSGKGG